MLCFSIIGGIVGNLLSIGGGIEGRVMGRVYGLKIVVMIGVENVMG